MHAREGKGRRGGGYQVADGGGGGALLRRRLLRAAPLRLQPAAGRAPAAVGESGAHQA